MLCLLKGVGGPRDSNPTESSVFRALAGQAISFQFSANYVDLHVQMQLHLGVIVCKSALLHRCIPVSSLCLVNIGSILSLHLINIDAFTS